jgi:hypothetical protein
MRFSIQPEQRPEQRMHTVHIEEIMAGLAIGCDKRPPLEHYFSPSRKEAFIKGFLHYLNTELLEVKHGTLDLDLYLVFLLTFQFTSPLLEIPTGKEMELFTRILQKNYEISHPDLDLHFSIGGDQEEMLGEAEALEAYRNELDQTWQGSREVKEGVRKRLKMDALEAIMKWQREQNLQHLAEAFGRSIVIPSFFDFTERRLVGFYRENTGGITYQVAIPESLEI